MAAVKPLGDMFLAIFLELGKGMEVAVVRRLCHRMRKPCETEGFVRGSPFSGSEVLSAGH